MALCRFGSCPLSLAATACRLRPGNDPRKAQAVLAPGEERVVKGYGACAKPLLAGIRSRTAAPAPNATVGMAKVIDEDGSSWQADARTRGFMPDK
jgi:hypothetical protein